MNARKDIFTTFKEGSERLSVRPTPHAWQRLERRLDGHRNRQSRIVAMTWLAAVAALLILVVGVFFIGRLSGGPSVSSSNEPAPTMLEDLVNTDGCNPYCLLIKERKALPDYYANPVRK